MTFYRTRGVCARTIGLETDGKTVTKVEIRGGCRGQSKALPRLVVGLETQEAIRRLRGIVCRNGTSCADQLARALAVESDRIQTEGRTSETGKRQTQ